MTKVLGTCLLGAILFAGAASAQTKPSVCGGITATNICPPTTRVPESGQTATYLALDLLALFSVMGLAGWWRKRKSSTPAS
jgi:hypothetical protein